MKKILPFIFCLFIVCSAYYVSANRVIVGKQIKTHRDYETLIEVWSVDSFEGGCGSRRDFLAKTALKFEKSRGGVIVSVISYTPEGVAQALKEKTPDIISCGNGLSLITEYAKSVNVKNRYGVLSYGGREYGVEWCKGIYVIFGKDTKRLVVSQAEYTQPLRALKQSGLKYDKVELLSPERAYYEYLKGGCSLLGTQRDFYRLENKGLEYDYQLIGGYCDLFMVAVLTCKNESNLKTATAFLSYLISEETQKRLPEIGMLSTRGYRLYKDNLLSQAEGEQVKVFTSFFTDPLILKQMQQEDLTSFVN